VQLSVQSQMQILYQQMQYISRVVWQLPCIYFLVGIRWQYKDELHHKQYSNINIDQGIHKIKYPCLCMQTFPPITNLTQPGLLTGKQCIPITLLLNLTSRSGFTTISIYTILPLVWKNLKSAFDNLGRIITYLKIQKSKTWRQKNGIR
jgi:hypothetical protein